MKKVLLKIGGMTCSACSSGLEKYLNKQEGVKASVNLVMNNALVEYADSHGGTLKTRVDFLCDEFRKLCTDRTAYGNMLTVARSRNIFFHFFLQRIFTIS